MNVKISIIIMVLLALISCSSKPKPYAWRANSASAFSSYTQSFLKDDYITAKSELDSAIEYAKSSANLEQLASIYLGKCALNHAVGIKDNGKQYQSIAHLLHSPALDAYYHLIHGSLTSQHIALLPPQYQAFATAKLNANYTKAFDAILAMDRVSSKLIATVLIKNYLTTHQRAQILDIASQYGYKKAVIFWLKEQHRHTTDQQSKKIIMQKIGVIEKP